MCELWPIAGRFARRFRTVYGRVGRRAMVGPNLERCSEKVRESLSSYRYSWKAERLENSETRTLTEVAIYF